MTTRKRTTKKVGFTVPALKSKHADTLMQYEGETPLAAVQKAFNAGRAVVGYITSYGDFETVDLKSVKEVTYFNTDDTSSGEDTEGNDITYFDSTPVMKTGFVLSDGWTPKIAENLDDMKFVEIEFGGYTVRLSKSTLAIGCQKFDISEWRKRGAAIIRTNVGAFNPRQSVSGQSGFSDAQLARYYYEALQITLNAISEIVDHFFPATPKAEKKVAKKKTARKSAKKGARKR